MLNTSPSPVYAYGHPPTSRSPQHVRSNSGNNYYEDVDPRFAVKQEESHAQFPSALIPGPAGKPTPPDPPDVPNGSCSPTPSETSHFTSISEGPVNPRWRPPLPPGPQQKTDIVLENNPDFELPATLKRGAGVGVAGRMPPLISPEPSRYPMP